MDNLKQKYELFHKNAKIQPKIVNNENFTYHIVLSYIDKYLQPKMNILDIGCGLGAISLYIANKGNKVTGTDISEKAINAAQESAKKLNVNNVSFKAIDFLNSDFKDKFDLIIINGVLEHLIDDEKALSKIYNLLNPKGILYLMVPSVNSPLHKLRMFFQKKDNFDIEVGHLRRYSPAGLITKLKGQRFRTLETKEHEGFIRELLFLTSIGNKLIRITRFTIIKYIINIIDELLVKIFGGSAVYLVAKKD